MTTQSWQPDTLLAGFEQQRIAVPADAAGASHATLVRLPAPPSARVVLYVHGFNDYFHQRHLAHAYAAQGYAFYAVDLRRYGRSLEDGQPPNYCVAIRDYFAEIDAALAVIEQEHPGAFVVLNGHSTGGLTSALYAAEGSKRSRLGAVVLNSPFFEFFADGRERVLLGVAQQIARVKPLFVVKDAVSPFYGESLHRSKRGEWEFDVRLKPIAGFDPYAGWLRAIATAHKTIHSGVQIPQPVLVLHSARSIRGKTWNDGFASADAVLDVAHIAQYGRTLGPRPTVQAIEGGLHDLVLSRPEVRAKVFTTMFDWLGGVG